ncbi:MAG TPA: YfiR family protein [Polyangiales bacterium]|nr:YfiR family protein [Polyangiales bacterium]
MERGFRGCGHRALSACAAICLAAATFGLSIAGAEDAEVPVRLQIDLLGRVLPYDRNFAARAGEELHVLVVIKSDDADSKRLGAQILAELRARSLLGQVRHTTELVSFSDARTLAGLCKARRAGLVYLSSGLRNELPAIAQALRGSDVLSVATLADDVKRGAVLGFSASSGKPKLLVQLAQARSQHVDFRADFLRLAQVVTP